jgi:ribonuclease P protein component
MSQKSKTLRSFDKVFRKGKSLRQGSIQIFFRENEEKHFLWGVAVSSKKWRKATQRNSIKRRIRVAFFPLKKRIEKNFDIVFLFCGQSVDSDIFALREDMEKGLTQIGLLTKPL